MKILLTAIALTIAAPAFAQAAPADAHAGHDGAKHEDHHGDCCEKGADGKMACCEEMKATAKKMACCDKEAGKDKAADAHAGHDMSKP
jgi:hypothetical protein